MSLSLSLSLYSKYSTERKTNTYKISYYVKDNFHSEYQGSLGRLEASVEEEYINNLKHACYREKNYSKYGDGFTNEFTQGRDDVAVFLFLVNVKRFVEIPKMAKAKN